jgi:hypothetical protein
MACSEELRKILREVFQDLLRLRVRAVHALWPRVKEQTKEANWKTSRVDGM